MESGLTGHGWTLRIVSSPERCYALPIRLTKPNTLHKLLVVLLFGLMTLHPATGTTIVAVRTQTEIFIGADSKESRTGDKTGALVSRTVCKIGQTGGLFFATSGFSSLDQTGFSLNRFVKEQLGSGPQSATTQKIQALTEALKVRLLSELQLIEKRAPKLFEERFISGPPICVVLIATFAANRPLVFTRVFLPETGYRKNGELFITGIHVGGDDVLADNAESFIPYALGNTKAITPLWTTPEFWRVGIVEGIRSLIEMEIAAEPSHTGGPIDILRITSDGAKWIQRKQECPDIDKASNQPPTH